MVDLLSIGAGFGLGLLVDRAIIGSLIIQAVTTEKIIVVPEGVPIPPSDCPPKHFELVTKNINVVHTALILIPECLRVTKTYHSPTMEWINSTNWCFRSPESAGWGLETEVFAKVSGPIHLAGKSVWYVFLARTSVEETAITFKGISPTDQNAYYIVIPKLKSGWIVDYGTIQLSFEE